MLSPYRDPAPEPVAIEPERPWFPAYLELVRIVPKKDGTNPFDFRHVGHIGWVSIILEDLYMVSFGRQSCGFFHLFELEPVNA